MVDDCQCFQFEVFTFFLLLFCLSLTLNASIISLLRTERKIPLNDFTVIYPCPIDFQSFGVSSILIMSMNYATRFGIIIISFQPSLLSCVRISISITITKAIRMIVYLLGSHDPGCVLFIM